jgi:group I intron endonuclease
MVLGRALTKYGSESFELIILEECSPVHLDSLEREYIKNLRPEYNMNEGGVGNTGHRLSDAAKANLSRRAKENWNRLPQNTKDKIIKQCLIGPKKGHHVSRKTRDMLRRSALKQWSCGMPQEIKNKISNALKGKRKTYKSRKASVVQIDPITMEEINRFEYIIDAAKNVGCHPGNIVAACKGRQNTAKGFIWKYSCSVETIPEGSRAGDELPPEAQGT